VSGVIACDEQLIDAPTGRDRAERPQWGLREKGRPVAPSG